MAVAHAPFDVRKNRKTPSRKQNIYFEIEQSVLGYFKNPLLIKHLSFKEKKDAVTEHDQNIENIIKNIIRKKFSDHSIYGEESGLEKENSDFIRHIDPIDNTTGFINGEKEYSSC